MTNTFSRSIAAMCGAALLSALPGAAQTPAPKAGTASAAAGAAKMPPEAAAAVAAAVTPPADFVIGPDDVLTVVFWREKEVSGDVTVRPDGRISIPLLNDVQAAGLTPSQLRDKLMESAAQFLEDPNATVVVKQINSRKVFITGLVNKPGPYVLTSPTTVLQLIAMAGGLLEFARSKEITVIRMTNGQQTGLTFNYQDVVRRKNMKQNIELKPGDTVIVP